MTYRTIGLMSPGDMGHAVGRALSSRGFRVITALEGRSARTRALAGKAGLEDVGGLDEMVRQADLLLSILVPAAALAFAERAVQAMQRVRCMPLFAECNAVSPMTSERIGSLVAAVGADYLDAGLIGSPPGRGQATRLYVSGPGAERLLTLAGDDLRVEPLGPEIGRASALKMMYAALNKGTWALQTAVLLASERFGLTEAVCAEIAHSQRPVYERMQAWLGFLAADSHRWIGEMQEISETFASAGVTPRFHQGAEEVFRLLAATPLAEETRETWDRSRSLAESVRIYADALPPQKTAG